MDEVPESERPVVVGDGGEDVSEPSPETVLPEGAWQTDPVPVADTKRWELDPQVVIDDGRTFGLASGVFDGSERTDRSQVSIVVEEGRAEAPVFEILDSKTAAVASPIGAAVALDRKALALSSVVEFDLEDVQVPFGGDGFGRLQLWYFDDCYRVDDDLSCATAVPLPTVSDSVSRTVRVETSGDDIAKRIEEQQQLRAESGLFEKELGPVLPGDGRAERARADARELPVTPTLPSEEEQSEREEPSVEETEQSEPAPPEEAEPSPTAPEVPGTTAPVVPETTLPAEPDVPESTTPETTVPATSLPESAPTTETTDGPPTTEPQSSEASTTTVPVELGVEEFGVVRERQSTASPSEAGGFGMMAMMSSSSSSQGDWEASPHGALLDVQVGPQSGGLETYFPIPVPDAAAGPSPQVGLSYSSQAVDGMSTFTNTQGGPVGVGWALTNPSITRIAPQGCSSTSYGESCYFEEYNLSMNGTASPLVETNASNPNAVEFRLQNEAFWKIVRHYDSALDNGDDQGEWWKVTTPDGTVFEFGRTADSTDYAPMYYQDANHPSSCSLWAAQWTCQKAYQWNVSSVVDLDGNGISYRYAQEFNQYRGRGGGSSQAYWYYVRASRVEEISYTEHSSMASPNARVRFNWEWRCQNSAQFVGCEGGPNNPGAFPDTPLDLDCVDRGFSACASSNDSQTYWSSVRLGAIATQVRRTGGSFNTVALYDFFQGLPDPDVDRYADDWEKNFSDPDDSGAKSALFAINQRPGGEYEHWGIGQIEAEDWDWASGISAPSEPWNWSNDIDGGRLAGKFDNGDYIAFDNVKVGEDAGTDPTKIYLRASSNAGQPGLLQVRTGSSSGPLLGEVYVNTNGKANHTTYTINLSDNQIYGIHDIYIVGATPGMGVYANWFRFDEGNQLRYDRLDGLITDFFDDEHGFAWLPNRVDSGAGISPMMMPRIEKVTNTFGGSMIYTYDQPGNLRCGGSIYGSSSSSINWPYNQTLCYPGFDGNDGNPGAGWVKWHKWVVTQTDTRDTYTDNEESRTTYQYGAPAWGLSGDAVTRTEMPLCGYTQWNDYRGFNRITVTTFSLEGSTTTAETRSREDYFQGMDADPTFKSNTSGSCVRSNPRSVDRQYTGTGNYVADRYWYRGRPMQTATLEPSTGYLHHLDQMEYNQSTTGGGLYGKRFTWLYTERSFIEPNDDNLQRGIRHHRNTTYGYETKTEDWGLTGISDNTEVRRSFAPDGTKWVLNKQYNEELWDLVGTDKMIARTSTAYGTFATWRPDRVRRYESATSFEETDVLSWDSQGRVTKIDDPNDWFSASTYHPDFGYPSSTANEYFTSSTTTRDDLMRPKTITDANGNTTHVTYDGYGRTRKVWLAPHSTSNEPDIEHTYGTDAAGVRYVTTKRLFDDAGNGAYTTTTSYFDGFGRQVQTDSVSPGDPTKRSIVNVKLDGLGRVTLEGSAAELSAGIGAVDWNWSTMPMYTKTDYDAMGRPTSATQRSMGSVTEWSTTWDYDGLKTTTTDPNGNPTDTHTDIRGNHTMTVEYTNGNAYYFSWAYDRANRVVSHNPSGQGDDGTYTGDISTYTYDWLGRQLTHDDPDRGLTTTTYDNNGNILTTNGPRTGTPDPDLVWNRYNRLNWPESSWLGTSTSDPILKDWVWDTSGSNKGSLTQTSSYEINSANNAALQNRVDYSHDQLGRVTGETHHFPGVGAYTMGFDHYSGGALKEVTYPDGETVTSTYNSTTGLLAAASSDTTPFELHSAGYDYAGRPDTFTYGSSGTFERSWTYHADTGRLHQLTAGSGNNWNLMSNRYYYDNNGNVTYQIDFRNPAPANSGGQVQCNTYDDRNRLTDSWTAMIDTSATMVSQCAAGPSNTFNSSLYGLITADPGTTYDQHWTHAASSEIATFVDNSNNIDWDYNYISTTQPGGPSAPFNIRDLSSAALVHDYDYDAAGNTTMRRMHVGAPQEINQTLSWDAFGRLTEVTDGTDVHTNKYNIDNIRIKRTTPNDTTIYVGSWWERNVTTGDTVTNYQPGGSLSAVSDGTTVTYLFGDHQGSTNVSVDHNGGNWQRQRYTPYGAPRGNPTINATTRGFISQHEDPTDLAYLNNRHYDPTTGVFVSVDPLVTKTMQPYIYGAANPVTYSDPDGLCPFAGCWEQFDRVLLELSGASPPGSARERERELLAERVNNVAENASNTFANGNQWYSNEHIDKELDIIDCWMLCYQPSTPVEDFLKEHSVVRCAQEFDCALAAGAFFFVAGSVTAGVCSTSPVTLGATLAVCVAAGSGTAAGTKVIMNATLEDPLTGGLCAAAVGGANPVTGGVKRIGGKLVAVTTGLAVCS